ncbi:MAG: type II toxin-antitoxin system VapC family toxin [Rhodospirillaceae bacterium]|nr:type II toxin-antitoxin system VapC family toxin [Rhodospirillaceae bacterium]
MLLLDTVALSEFMKSRPNPRVLMWLRRHDPSAVFISVVTLGEVERGIESQRRDDPAFARSLENWRNDIIGEFGERVLPVTIDISLLWGRLGRQRGHLNVDLLIAATAIAHDLTVVTRNVRHFDGTGAKILNPFEG